jgi:hypothetical protein
MWEAGRQAVTLSPPWKPSWYWETLPKKQSVVWATRVLVYNNESLGRGEVGTVSSVSSTGNVPGWLRTNQYQWAND